MRVSSKMEAFHFARVPACLLTISSLPHACLQAAFTNRPATASAFHSLPVVVQPGLEIVGLGLDGLDFVIFFASVQLMADGFNRGMLPPSSARFVKFARRDASADKTMFRPETWQLRNRHRLRRFQEDLEYALADHATTFSTIPEYLFAATTDKLDRRYQRMGGHFASGELGVTFDLKYVPDAEAGGFLLL